MYNYKKAKNNLKKTGIALDIWILEVFLVARPSPITINRDYVAPGSILLLRFGYRVKIINVR